ncbi:MAG: glucose-6-phosphate isomerase [Rhodospirillaceae bacterium]|nr:glucose-6-phosphate isomerase [Rhodospirillaceae bacterium]MBT3886537.1 glucose-6-phosphate isomerase [Rhodospirillaceae bacterium]MBT4116134.1 glucose-6-phosphate isomerase [Rhodospirillaceae bacterium]MBT4672932.1 glucose-6-phosphate isomerase [Rhodospirillaceae bacterium]MBT4750340.1 glucose-6-phosphate isomerase [Rhodospirillaceae bacterium]
MSYQQNTDGCFAGVIGETGLGDDAYQALLRQSTGALENLRARLVNGTLPFLDMGEAAGGLYWLEPIAENYIEAFDHVVCLGVGGSSLGAKTLCALAAPPAAGERPRLHFMDNIDPDSFAVLFGAIDPARTGFIVTSKSGATAETLTQFLIALDWMRSALPGVPLGDHFTIITQPGPRPLRRLAEEFAMTILDHDANIGGRYAGLSVVGLLPALIAGLDGEALRQGAADTLQPLLDGAGPEDFAPAIGAAINVGLAQTAGVTATVMMPYLDRMEEFGAWYRQLWAESLGKNGLGTTPIRALGTVDQHSQLQLYLDGPGGMMFTLITGPAKGVGGMIDAKLATEAGLGYLAGHRMGDLLDAEQRATAAALTQYKRPVRIISLERLDEAAMGALMMHFMIETVIAAHLLGVNAFDQPAVEAGKVLARRTLEEDRP